MVWFQGVQDTFKVICKCVQTCSMCSVTAHMCPVTLHSGKNLSAFSTLRTFFVSLSLCNEQISKVLNLQ